MNHRQKGLQRGLRGCIEAIAECDRPHGENERREAARALGIEAWLPDGEQEEMELKGQANGKD